jgi:putative hydrolase of the HAD superfamily
MSIKALVFDFGGVIAFFQDEKDLAAMAGKAGVAAPLMKKLYWETRYLYDQGSLSGAEYFSCLLKAAGNPQGAADRSLLAELIQMDIESWAHINPETEKFMRDAKNEGYKIAILSNMIQPFIDWARTKLPLFSQVDVGIYSCEVNEIKPHAAIYRILLDRLGCAAEETLFFDDVAENVAGAQKAGIHARLWQGAALAREELTRVGQS